MKMSLIIGGSGSGKSEFAEALCLKEGNHRLYIATMEPFGEEGKQRIERHHQLRKGKGFETLECYTGLEFIQLSYYDVIMVECISNLVANELYSNSGRKNPQKDIIIAMDQFVKQCDHLVVVTNNTGEEVVEYKDDMVDYQKELGQVNQLLARKADSVIEIVLGQPIGYKE